MRKPIFIALALYILAAPALPQLFGVESALIRPWKMFAGVGIGIPKGDFTVTRADGSQIVLTPLEVLGQPTYPDIRHYDWPRLVYNEERLKVFAAEFCAALPAGNRLSFDGAYGWSHGFRSVTSADVCGEEADG